MAGIRIDASKSDCFLMKISSTGDHPPPWRPNQTYKLEMWGRKAKGQGKAGTLLMPTDLKLQHKRFTERTNAMKATRGRWGYGTRKRFSDVSQPL